MNKLKTLMISASTVLVMNPQTAWTTEIPSPAQVIGTWPYANVWLNDTNSELWTINSGYVDSLVCSSCLWIVGYQPFYPVNPSIYIEPYTGHLLYLADGGTGDDNMGIGTVTPNPSYKLDMRGKMRTLFSGASTGGDGFSPLISLEAYNSAANKTSDSGFSLKNLKANFQWNFRSYESSQGFAATKNGSGGAEMIVQNPTNNFHNVSIFMGNGAWLTSSGQWLNASSREYKENFEPIDLDEATRVLEQLNPVKFNFKRDTDKELNLGFIAEEVPELVATKDRKNLDTMKVVATLTKIVQYQQKIIQQQQAADEKKQKVIHQQQGAVTEQQKVIHQQQQAIAEQKKLSMALSEKLAELDQLVRSSAMVVIK